MESAIKKYSYLDGLNDEQLSAVLQTEGQVIVFAGAGSGKTRVITNRVLHLIKKGLAEPRRILGVTFTNKAAKEMRGRIKAALGTDRNGLPELSTFHSFCLKILRSHAHLIGYQEPFTILDEDDADKILKDVIDELNIDILEEEKAKNFISDKKSRYISAEQMTEDNDSPLVNDYVKAYKLYAKKLKELNAMDFDDFIFNAVLVFETKPAVLELYQDFYKYIMVDEFQDTNYIQDKFIKMLADKHKNICVVGDDDQSIYGFRGARVENILEFKENYAECKEFYLSKNYRSTETILEAASNVININKKRKNKDIVSVKKGGLPVKILSFEDDNEESNFIASEIKRLIENGYSYKDIAVLYRMGFLSKGIEKSLISNNIDYQIYGGLKFYQRKEIKDILSFIKFALNPNDLLSFKRSTSCVPIGAGDKTTDNIASIAEKNGVDVLSAFKLGFLAEIKGLDGQERTLFNIDEHTTDKSKLLSYFNLITKIRNIAKTDAPAEIIKLVFTESGYKKLLSEKIIKDETEGERIDNVDELIKIASGFRNISELLDTSALDVEAGSDKKEEKDKKEENKVTLSTIHSVKGLEFKIVFMIGLEEGIFPYYKAVEENEIEEERRLCYVGITRAKEILYITCAEQRWSKKNKSYIENDSSMFIDEMEFGNIAEFSTSLF